ncbi:carbohydrate esterase family 1 protein, partial [Hortaea werneckii]
MRCLGRSRRDDWNAFNVDTIPSSLCKEGDAKRLSNIANNPSDLGGRYYDPAYGVLWNVQCAQGSSNTAYFGSWSTNGQGIYACWKGCEKRIGCTAISFDSTNYQQTGPTIGGGRCYGYSDIGNYTASTLYYASANILVPNTYFPCPTYNGSTYTNPQDGSVWQIRCGVSLDPGTTYASTSESMMVDMPSCLTACNGVAQCTAAWWQYNSNTEYKDTDPQAKGNCYYRTGTVTYNANPSAAAAVRISSAVAGWVATSSSTAQPTCTAYSSTVSSVATTMSSSTSSSTSSTSSGTTSSSTSSGSTTSSSTSSSPTTSSSTSSSTSTSTTSSTSSSTSSSVSSSLTSSSTSSSTTPSTSSQSASTTGTSTGTSSTSTPTSTCTGSITPNNLPLSCSGQPAGQYGTFLSTCGNNYTLYCGYDNNPGAAATRPASSLAACMALCDGYAGCRSASFSGNTCYIKTGYQGLTNANSGLGVLALNVPPNPAYPVPVLAPGTNTSSGCGTPLPNGVTPDGSSTTFILAGPDGFSREYAIHIPKYYDTNRASPLIMAFPGNGDTAANIEPQTRMSNSELNPYGIAVYVTGVNRGFVSNPGWGVPGSTNANVDDIGFIKTLVAYLTSNYCVDTGRIFATGHSNGGGFCNVMACDPVLSVTFAAFAPASGAFYTGATSGNPETIEPVNTPTQPQCSPGRNNVPMLEFHGTNDGTINYYGGPRNGRILPTLPHWATAWSARQGYGITNYTSNDLPSLNPAMTVTKYEFGGDAGQLGIVTHYRLGGWTHNYPNVDTTSSAPVNGPQIVMDFFYRWTNPSRQSVYFPANVTRSSASSSMSSTSATASSSTSGSTSSTNSAITTSSTATTSSSSISSISSSSSSQAASTASTTGQTSSSSVTTTSSSSASASASATGTSCPQANGTTVTVDGQDFVVECGWDHAGGDISSEYVDSFYQCISICVATPSCILITFRANLCSLKSLVGDAVQGEVSGAILVSVMSPSSSSTSVASSTVSTTLTSRPAGAQFTAGSDSSVCPQYNNTAYTSPGGRTYTPYCGGFQAIGTGYSSRDVVASTFEDCMAQCDDTEDCNAVDYYVASSTCGLLIGGVITRTTRRDGYDAAILGEPSSPASSSTAGGMSMSETASLSTSMSTMSMSVSDASSMPSETPSSMPNAPCANNTAIMSEDGTSYTLFCGYDTEGEEAFDTMTYEDGDWIQCEDFCDASDGCEVWVWQYQVEGGGTCSVRRLPQTLRRVNDYDAQSYVVGYVSNAVPSASSSVAGPAPSTSMAMSTSEEAGGPSSYQDATVSSTSSQMNGMTSSSSGTTATSSSTSSPLIITDYYSTPSSSEAFATTPRISSFSVSPSGSMSMTMDQSQSSISSNMDSPSGYVSDSISISMSMSTIMDQSPSSTSSDANSPSGYRSDSMSMSMSMSTSMSASMDQSQSSMMSDTSNSSGASNPPGYTSTPDAMSTSITSSGMSSSQGLSNPPGYSLTTDSVGSVVSSSISSSSGASNPVGYTSSPGVTDASSTSSSEAAPPEYSQTSQGSIASASGGITPNPSSPITSSASLQGCSVATTAAASGSACADPYGNTYNVSSGTRYIGSVRAVVKAPSLSSCLTTCDETPGCVATNYNSTSGACYILDNVTGVEEVFGPDAAGVQAASRPADVTSVASTPPPMYTTPPEDMYPTTTVTAGPDGSPVAAEDSEACSMAEADGTECIDSYGNSFTVSSGTRYRGSVRAVNHARNLDECLAFCDALGSDCEAANFDSASGDCELLDDVTGIEIVSGPDANGALAASRPADVGTIYTTPLSTTTGMTSPGTYAGATTTAASMSMSPGDYQTGPGPVPSASLTNVGPIATSSSAAPAVSTGAVSEDGTCGLENDGRTCEGSGFGDCCSEYGFCGSTDFYCDTGCLVGYGRCNNAPVQSNSASTSSSQGGSTSGGSNSPTTTTTRINSISVVPMPGSSATGSPSAGPSSSVAASTPGGYSGPQSSNPASSAAPTSSTSGSNPSGYPGSASSNSPPPQSPIPTPTSSGPLTTGTSTPPSNPPLCPTYDTRSYQDPPTSTPYNISCGTAYTGTTISPQLYRRQESYSQDVTARECITTCSDDPACIAITFVPSTTTTTTSAGTGEQQGECRLFSSLTGISYAPDAVSALKTEVAGEGDGVVGVVTVTAS